MTLFRYIAYLAPLAVGFGIPAALALTRGRPLARRARAAGAVWGGTVALLGLAAFTESFGALAAVAALVTAFALFVAGLFLLGEAIALPAEACQIAATLAVCLLMSTVFWFGPVLEHAVEVRMPMTEISRRIMLALDINPATVMGYSVFGHDWVRAHAIYAIPFHEYPIEFPRWKSTSLGYAAGGAVLLALAAGGLALRSRFSKPA